MDTVALDSPVAACISSDHQIEADVFDRNKQIRDSVGKIFLVSCLCGVGAMIGSVLFVSSNGQVDDDGNSGAAACSIDPLVSSDQLDNYQLNLCRASAFLAHASFTILDNLIWVIAVLDWSIVRRPLHVTFPSKALVIAFLSAFIETFLWLAIPVSDGHDIAIAFIVYVIQKCILLIMLGALIICDTEQKLRRIIRIDSMCGRFRILSYIFISLTTITSVLPLILSSNSIFTLHTIHHVVICIHMFAFSLFIKTQV
jgi:hypothetical protein